MPVPPDSLLTFGQRLSWAIENAPGIGTQAELCRRLGVSSAYVANLSGKHLPPGKKALRKLSETLGVSEAWLAYGTDAGTAGANRGAMRGEGAAEEAEKWYVEELKRISALDEAEWRKTLYRDSAASAFNRVIEALAERSRAERAHAFRDAEAASTARAGALQKSEPRRAREVSLEPRPTTQKKRRRA